MEDHAPTLLSAADIRDFIEVFAASRVVHEPRGDFGPNVHALNAFAEYALPQPRAS